jgi:hypothetical protein
MRQFFVLFLLFAMLAPGAIGQSKKFQRKLNNVIDKPYEDKIFECKKHPLPKTDFQAGEYQVKNTSKSSINWLEYDVFRNNILVAHINVYSETIIKITAIKTVDSFAKAAEELKTHPKATIGLIGESWYKEIAPYLKEAKDNGKKYIVIYEDITYIIMIQETTTIYKNE